MNEPFLEIEVALLVARALEDLGIEYAVGGSIASGLQGEPRSTNDVDLAVRLKDGDVAALENRLGPDFVVDAEGLRAAIRERGSHSIYYLPSVVKVDLFIHKGEPFDESESARRVRLPAGEGQAMMFVASAEDILLRKLGWFRLGGEVSDRQWRDVLGILRVSGPALDRGYLSEWADKLGVADLLARVLAQA